MRAGWAWGSPVTELRWYVTGLGSEATLLDCWATSPSWVVPVASAVLLRPSLGRVSRLTAPAPAGGTTIDLLQWLLPLGRVVSPLDALLNAIGALAAGLLAAHVGRRGPAAARCRPALG